MNYEHIELSCDLNKEFLTKQAFKSALKRTKISQKKDVFSGFPKSPKPSDYAGWIFPQILAHFGNKKVLFKDGMVSPSKTLENWNLSLEEKTWLEYITTSPRSLFLESGKNPSLSSAVPLVLSAFKTYQNVCYESWDFQDPSIVTFLEPLHRELLPLRNQDLPDPKDLSWNTLEAKLDGYPRFGEWESDTLGTMPRIAKYIYTQTWLWHPNKKHPLAIASLKNWDLPESVLHQSNIF